MVVVIIGVPDSGKSQMAEQRAMELANNSRKYYIATMIPFGEEGEKRVQKHRKMRAGKGFETIECPVNLGDRVDSFKDFSEATCLLECMSNLVGNEMHGEKSYTEDELIEQIVSDVGKLCAVAENVVIVSNSFDKDGEGYDEDTRNYVRALDRVNDRLKDLSDETYEFSGGNWMRTR